MNALYGAIYVFGNRELIVTEFRSGLNILV